tara:strand:- start:299 stop:454 length:156 start_codon:yes stop_codon:yes gene_type:complete
MQIAAQKSRPSGRVNARKDAARDAAPARAAGDTKYITAYIQRIRIKPIIAV